MRDYEMQRRQRRLSNSQPLHWVRAAQLIIGVLLVLALGIVMGR